VFVIRVDSPYIPRIVIYYCQLPAVPARIGHETIYTRRFTRHNGTIVSDGDPYLDDPTLAELFAFLLEQNDARQAVARGDDLREIIMRPVDTARIESQISKLESKKKILTPN